MKVLLLQPAPPFPSFGDALPIGLACIASFLRREGMDVRLIDLGKQNLTADFVPDIIGIGASTPYFKRAVDCSRKVRSLFPKSRIIFGGPHVSAMPDDAFPYADCVIRGEGELAMLDVCRNGIRGQIMIGVSLKELDNIPLPSADLMDFLYANRSARLHVLGARGCPFNCVFCAEHTRTIRYHSVDYFVENLRVVAQRYHNDILVADDIFTINKERTSRICEEILRQGLNLRLSVFGHITCFDRDLLLLMKRAGVHTVSYGIESGNNDILKLINKKFTIERAEEIIRKTAETGMNVNCLYMVGNIGETKKTVADTVTFALRASHQRWCSFALPFPGSRFYEVAEQYGTVLTRDWSKYTNRNIVFVPYGMTEKDLREARDAIIGTGEGASSTVIWRWARALRTFCRNLYEEVGKAVNRMATHREKTG